MRSIFTLRNIFLFLILVALLCIAWLIYAFYHVNPSTPPTTEANANCYESAQYLVIDKNPGLPGLDLAIRHKSDPNEIISCEAEASLSAQGATILQNDLPEDVIGLSEQFLIIDSGTAPPPRGLIVYNLDTQTSTFMDTYSPPVTIATGTITYWEKTKTAPTPSNCSNLSQFQTEGLDAVIEEQISLDLATLKKTDLGQMQCVPTQ